MSDNICISSSDSQVQNAIYDFFAYAEVKGMYSRWSLEVSRRKLARYEANYLADKTSSLKRNIWICAVGYAEEHLRHAQFRDDYVNSERKWFPEENKSDKYYYFFTSLDPIEIKRDEALKAAEQIFKQTCDQDAFDAAVSAAEEEYYNATTA